MKRTASLKRSSKPIARKSRTASEKTRVYGSPQRIAWMHASRCVITGGTPCQIAHVRTGGMGRKSDARWTVPMIAALHRELHEIGVRSFEQKYAVDLEALAVATNLRWEAA